MQTMNDSISNKTTPFFFPVEYFTIAISVVSLGRFSIQAGTTRKISVKGVLGDIFFLRTVLNRRKETEEWTNKGGNGKDVD